MMMAAELHIRPWEIGDLTVTQVRQAVRWCQEEQTRRARGE